MVKYIAIVLVTYLFNGAVVDSRNMDSNNYQMLNETIGSLFGYSMATHYSSLSLLVGAPGLENFSGAIFRCEIKTAKCLDFTNIVSDAQRNNANTNSSAKWLGATVLSQDELIVVCAPNFREMGPGRCYYTNKTEPYSQKFDLLPFIEGYPDKMLEMCITGMSAALSTSGEKITNSSAIITAGGSCANGPVKGSWVYKLNSFSKSALVRVRPLKEYGISIESMGYALAAGTLKPKNTSFYAVSVGLFTRSGYKGMVQILDLPAVSEFNDTTGLLEVLSGTQKGEYFGGSLAVQDLNGDGRDDLVVGAPIHTNYSETINYEIGAVYIFYQSEYGKFNNSNSSTCLYGKAIAGRFGFSVAGLGDTNGDGFNDLAIGAPYENDGVVYIYHGSKLGVIPTPAQIIYGRDFKPPMKTFGWSFASVDYDGNLYKDIIIGAPQSNSAVYIPARPFVTVDASAEFKPETAFVSGQQCSITEVLEEKTFSIGELIGLNKKKCVDIELCVSLVNEENFYKKVRLNKVPLTITVKLGVNGSFTERSSPVSFEETRYPNLQLKIAISPEHPECFLKQLNIEKFVNKNLTVSAHLTIAVDETSRPAVRGYREDLLPLVNNKTSTTTTSALNIIYKEASSEFSANVGHLPWWVYVACLVGALIIISIIVGVLAKLGFFKRTKPPAQASESQEQENERLEPNDAIAENLYDEIRVDESM